MTIKTALPSFEGGLPDDMHDISNAMDTFAANLQACTQVAPKQTQEQLLINAMVSRVACIY